MLALQRQHQSRHLTQILHNATNDFLIAIIPDFVSELFCTVSTSLAQSARLWVRVTTTRVMVSLQCFDTVGWAAGTASGL